MANMFSKMLGNIKGLDSDSKNDKLLEKIQKMDLADMRVYVNGKLTEFEVNDFGLCEIIKKITYIDEADEKLYIKADDMDSKKKKVFDLILLVLANKKISIATIEYIQRFLDIYSEIINRYDSENKQIYASKIKESISLALDKINFKSDVADKMRTLK